MGDRRERQTVRALRLNAGLTRDELARLAHISPPTLRHLERGNRSTVLGHEAERRVAIALGVSPEAIAWGTIDRDGPSVNLRAEREARKLTVSEVAERANVPRKTVRKAEAGGAVHPRYALRLAVFYGCAVAAFYPRPDRAAA
jgi:transcriptional regulator with XRE-family HTH domain